MSKVTAPSTHPYLVETGLAPQSTTSFQWTIRKFGKAFQRSDRGFPSEHEARRMGEKALERTLSNFDR